MRTQRILRLITTHYDVNLLELHSHETRNLLRVTEGKQAAAYMLWRHTDMTNAQIAYTLGYESGDNVKKARRAIADIASGNKAEAEKMQAIDKEIHRD